MSTAWLVWNAIHSMNAWTCRSVNSCLMTSHGDSWRMRCHTLPRGCSASRWSSDGPKPTGVNCEPLNADFTSS